MSYFYSLTRSLGSQRGPQSQPQLNTQSEGASQKEEATVRTRVTGTVAVEGERRTQGRCTEGVRENDSSYLLRTLSEL